MRILVTGSSGMLGGEFVEEGKKRGHEIIGWTREDFDLEKPETGIRRIVKLQPDTVIHCAAETDVDRCEREPSRASQVNAESAIQLAKGAGAAGSRLVFISTSGVFEGESKGPHLETDLPRPRTVYGRSKWTAEQGVLEILPTSLILRASWLYGGRLAQKKNFVAARIREATRSPVVLSSHETFGSPTWTQDFARRALELAEASREGIFHVANSGTASRFDYVREILECTSPGVQVRPVGNEAFPRVAPVPRNESLGSVREQGQPLPPWAQSLRKYLKSQGLCNSAVSPGTRTSPRAQKA